MAWQLCSACGGEGLKDGAICAPCAGNGKVRVVEPTEPEIIGPMKTVCPICGGEKVMPFGMKNAGQPCEFCKGPDGKPTGINPRETPAHIKVDTKIFDNYQERRASK